MNIENIEKDKCYIGRLGNAFIQLVYFDGEKFYQPWSDNTKPLDVKQAWEVSILEENASIPDAMNTIKKAMIDDNPSESGSWAHSWHCNIAMMCLDAMECSKNKSKYEAAQDAASRFMKLFFDVETKA